MSTNELLTFYRSQAVDQLIPFWQKAVDHQYGGVFTCFDNRGERLVRRDKFTWSQGRFVWLWSRIAWLIGSGQLPGDEKLFLREARGAIDFLIRNVFLENGRCAYVLTESGDLIDPPHLADSSIYADCFVLMGFAEYARVAGDRGVLDRAIQIYDSILTRLSEGTFRTDPYPIPPRHRAHGIAMIFLRVGSLLSAAMRRFGHERTSQIDDGVALAVREILEVFRLPDGRLQELIPDLENRDTLLARHATPGHIFESMWFVIHAALARDRTDWIQQAVISIRKAFALGWDSEHEGLFRYVDLAGGPPTGVRTGQSYEHLIADTWDTKIWWPHAEALYSLLLARHVDPGDEELATCYERLHSYVFRTFPHPDSSVGEWIQIRNRRGEPLDKCVALPVKDPYHILQAVLLIVEKLNGGDPC